jgi:hypothetical protein
MMRAELREEVTPLQTQDEPALRIKVVGEQREIEIKLPFCKNVRVVFFIRNPLTGAYIPREKIQYNEEKKIYEFTPEALKDEKFMAHIRAIISEAVLNDEKQLSTVLSRVELLEESEAPTVVFYSAERKNVDPSHFERFKREHPNFDFQRIDEAEYNSYLGKISEATYVYQDENMQPQYRCVFATQAIEPDRPSRWEVVKGLLTREPITFLNVLLKAYKKAEIPLPYNRSLLFTPSPANEAANTRLSTDTCRSPSAPSTK